MCVRRYNKKAATASAAAFYRLIETTIGGLPAAGANPQNHQTRTFPPTVATGSADGLAAVVVVLRRFGIGGLDFLADGGVLLLPERLAPVLHPAVQVHLAHVTRFDGTGTAAG